MTCVWVVEKVTSDECTYSCATLHGVFSSESLAETYVLECLEKEPEHLYDYSVTMRHLDEGNAL